MRVISGLVAAAMLAASAQPVFASCVYHGASKICHDDPKGWTPAASDGDGPEPEAPSEPAPSSLKTIVLQPSSPVDNAWVMIPEGGDGAIAPAVVPVAVPACTLGSTC
jgi:hypothetical protein